MFINLISIIKKIDRLAWLKICTKSAWKLSRVLSLNVLNDIHSTSTLVYGKILHCLNIMNPDLNRIKIVQELEIEELNNI